MPAAEIDVTEHLVRGLLVEQHPDLAGLPLAPVANGWDNAIFRLGDRLCVRLPRREMAAALVGNEQRWLGGLAPRLPIPVPAPIREGRPAGDYPWSWSICPWFDGEVAAEVALLDPVAEARRLGEFLAALHQAAPSEVPANPFFRGGPVAALTDRFRSNLEQLDDGSLREAALRRWQELAPFEEWDGPPLWVHGDLHTANVVVERGMVVAVIDFGDIAAGDPSVDLAIAWMLFEGDARDEFRRVAGTDVGIDDAMWRRAEAWALHFGVLYLIHSADNPRFTRMGGRLLGALLG